MAQTPVVTSQYGIFNFESISSGLNLWSILITLVIIIGLILLCESCCTGPTQILKCCFRRRHLLRNMASPASGQHGIELGNSATLGLCNPLQPWASYPGLAAANMLPPINWRDIALGQLARPQLSTTSALHPHSGGLTSLKMEDGRLAII